MYETQDLEDWKGGRLRRIHQYQPNEMPDINEGPMRILMTGGGGFLGQALTLAMQKDPRVQSITLTDVFKPAVPNAETTSTASPTCQLSAIQADLTSVDTCQKLFTSDLTHIYLLHGIMSGAAEANLDLGLRVNLDSMRIIADVLGKAKPGIRVIFPSSLAVFGSSDQVSTVTETTMPSPQSSYGAQKQICEVLLNDYSRRGLIDARIVRLPTIIVRPGAPSGAASSFCSGIIREPLKGERSCLPVSRDLELWVSSTRSVVSNLIIARDIPEGRFHGGSRIVNLPGKTVTVAQMLHALEMVAGKQATKLVEEVPDENVNRIVGSWPAHFDISRARELGFHDDISLTETIQDYLRDHCR